MAEKEIALICDCGSEVLLVASYTPVEVDPIAQTYIDIYTKYNQTSKFTQRVKAAWKILRNKEYIFDGVAFTGTEKITQLRNYLDVFLSDAISQQDISKGASGNN